MSGLFVLARKVNDMEFATTRGRHTKTISEVRCQTQKHNYQRKKEGETHEQANLKFAELRKSEVVKERNCRYEGHQNQL